MPATEKEKRIRAIYEGQLEGLDLMIKEAEKELQRQEEALEALQEQRALIIQKIQELK